MRKVAVITLALALAGTAACGGPSAPPLSTNILGPAPGSIQPLQKIYTEHLGQLTNSALNPLERLGFTGTDLGVSFERDGRIIFLFGDSRALDPAEVNDDSIAWIDIGPSPAETHSMPKLTWFQRPNGLFLPVLIPSVDMKTFTVLVDGVPLGTTTYLFAAAGFMSTSVLAHTQDLDFDSLVFDHQVPGGWFLNISTIVEPDVIWIFGSGPYRASAVYLAKVAPARLADRAAWLYYRGYQNGAPVFGASPSDAQPVVQASCVGELSVRKIPPLGYLMAYNCDEPLGILLRRADDPTGPWSPATTILNPLLAADQGFGYFMHQMTSSIGYDDGLSEPGREEEWGGEYGPYLVPQWTVNEAAGVHSLVYTLSSWNPYEAHLMRTIVAEPGVTASPPPPRGQGLPPATLTNGDFATGNLLGWQGSGDPFALVQGSDGHWRLTTDVEPMGDGVVGRLWQDFTLDSQTSELRFSVSGGDAAVKLLHGNEVVRASRGRRTNSPETPVRWFLSEFRGETLRLLIEDDLTGPWGFVTTTGFQFVREP